MATIMTTETALFDPYLVAEYDPYGGGADKAEEECIEIPDEEDEGEYGEDQPDESAEVAPKELEDPSSTWQVEEDTLPLQPDGFDEPRQLLEEDTLPEEAVTLEVYEEAEELMEEAAEVGEAADGLVYEEAGEEPQEEAEEEALVQYGDADVDEAGGLLAETAEEDLQVQAEAEEPSEPFGEAEEPQPPGEGGEDDRFSPLVLVFCLLLMIAKCSIVDACGGDDNCNDARRDEHDHDDDGDDEEEMTMMTMMMMIMMMTMMTMMTMIMTLMRLMLLILVMQVMVVVMVMM
eukprot:s3165_g7.t2